MRPRRLVLDGMRGVAALAVVALHLKDPLGIPEPPASYLAVDLFFMLSGFVLADAYAERLAGPLGPWGFMKLRLIRLYPLYIAGIVLGAMVGLVDAGKPGGWSHAGLAAAFVAAALYLPSTARPDGWATPMPYTLNMPMWSLFFELVANLVYAFAAPRLTTARLLALTVSLGALYALAAANFGTMNLGWRWEGFWGGLPRVGFAFCAGVLLHRLPPVSLPAWLSPLLLAALGGGLMLGSGAFWYGVLMVFAVFPAMVYLGAGCRPMLAGVMAFLGAISYAIYALHVPLLALADRITVEMIYQPLEAFAPWAGYAVLAAIVLAAWLAHRVYDEPVRRWLTARFAGPGRRQLWITPPAG